MASRLVPLTKCSLAILLSLLAFTLPAGSRADAIPAVAISVIDHGLSRQINFTQQYHFVPGNKTSVFTQDDPMIYAYFTAALTTANVTWLWIDPSGQVFANRTQQLHCGISPCTFIYYFPLKGNINAATKFGLWTMTLQAGGVNIYSDYFSVTPIILQDNHWNFEVTRSAWPPRVHGELLVTLHPSNGTWSSYVANLPNAANITAYEYPSNRTLVVVASNKTGEVVVNLGAARSNGYRFVLSFDLVNGVSVSPGGVCVFDWRESAWGTFNDGYHSVPGSFNITLPAGATVLDVTGINAMTLNASVTGSSRPVVGFRTILLADQSVGWIVLYHDPNSENSNPNSVTNAVVGGGLNSIWAQSLPFLPLTLGSLSSWAAVMSVFLLTGSELLAPAYGRTGVLVNRRRLRFAALILVSVFIGATVYAIILLQSAAPQVAH